jgi:hypothetical protein
MKASIITFFYSCLFLASTAQLSVLQNSFMSQSDALNKEYTNFKPSTGKPFLSAWSKAFEKTSVYLNEKIIVKGYGTNLSTYSNSLFKVNENFYVVCESFKYRPSVMVFIHNKGIYYMEFNNEKDVTQFITYGIFMHYNDAGTNDAAKYEDGTVAKRYIAAVKNGKGGNREELERAFMKEEGNNVVMAYKDQIIDLWKNWDVIAKEANESSHKKYLANVEIEQKKRDEERDIQLKRINENFGKPQLFEESFNKWSAKGTPKLVAFHTNSGYFRNLKEDFIKLGGTINGSFDDDYGTLYYYGGKGLPTAMEIKENYLDGYSYFYLSHKGESNAWDTYHNFAKYDKSYFFTYGGKDLTKVKGDLWSGLFFIGGNLIYIHIVDRGSDIMCVYQFPGAERLNFEDKNFFIDLRTYFKKIVIPTQQTEAKLK